jgi:NAD(P)-dependent dehydrogenase (short-subunit alcohol dehydrogenase family)
MDRLKGKVAVITGGASGIGEATAKLFAREGAKVIIADIDDFNSERVVSEIKASSGSVEFYHMDVSIEKEVSNAFSAVGKKYGLLNILVNDAGIAGNSTPSHQTSEEEWYKVIDVDLKGPFLCVKHAVPLMFKSGSGSIVNISSIMGITGGGNPTYNSAKGGLRLMTKADALVYAKNNIRVNSVHPGYIQTPLFRKIAVTMPLGVEGSIKDLSAAIPMGRMGFAEDIANGILFLASDDSSYITGSELIIDGGSLIS